MMTLYIQHYFSLLCCTRDTYSGFVIPGIAGSQETAFSLSPYPSYNILFMNAIINIQTLEYASISYIFAHFFTILYEKLLFVDSSSRNFGGYVVYLPYAMTDYIYFFAGRQRING